MYYILLVLVLVIIAFWFVYYKPHIFADCVTKCVHVHSENGENYPWLNDTHDGLDFIEYREPAIGANDWTRYTEKTWKAHCSKISHSPKDLVEAHRQVFLVNNSPIKLRFHWRDGTIEELQDIDEHLEYYRKEAEYFSNHEMCKNQKV